MAFIAPLAGEFLVAGALTGLGYALGKRKRASDSSEELASATKALKSSTEALAKSQAETVLVREQLSDLEDKLQCSLDDKAHSSCELAAKVEELEIRLEEAANAKKVSFDAVSLRLSGLEHRAREDFLPARLEDVQCQVKRVQERAERTDMVLDEKADSGQVEDLVQRFEESQVEQVPNQVRDLQRQLLGAGARTEALSQRMEMLEEELQGKAQDIRKIAEAASSPRVQLQAQLLKDVTEEVRTELQTWRGQKERLEQRLLQLEDHVQDQGRTQGHRELLEHLVADVDELKRTRRDHARELQNSDGLVLDTQAKLGSHAELINHVSERVRLLEIIYGVDTKDPVEESRFDGICNIDVAL